MIDHHASNPGFGGVRVFDPRAEATVVLVHQVLTAMGAAIDADIAAALRRPGHRHARLPHRGPLRAPAGRRPDRGRGAPARGGRSADGHPSVSAGWPRWAGSSRRARLEADEAGGLGLVHARVPLEISSRFRPWRSTA
jgi:phosphoesterase RecJ-like protein